MQSLDGSHILPEHLELSIHVLLLSLSGRFLQPKLQLLHVLTRPIRLRVVVGIAKKESIEAEPLHCWQESRRVTDPDNAELRILLMQPLNHVIDGNI